MSHVLDKKLIVKFAWDIFFCVMFTISVASSSTVPEFGFIISDAIRAVIVDGAFTSKEPSVQLRVDEWRSLGVVEFSDATLIVDCRSLICSQRSLACYSWSMDFVQ